MHKKHTEKRRIDGIYNWKEITNSQIDFKITEARIAL